MPDLYSVVYQRKEAETCLVLSVATPGTTCIRRATAQPSFSACNVIVDFSNVMYGCCVGHGLGHARRAEKIVETRRRLARRWM